jgi:hypothetical protein
MQVQRFLDLIGSIELTWLEAKVLFHHYYRNIDIGGAAERAGCHVTEAQAARETLVRKVAIKLGYNIDDD